jgi:hypothetical protein
VRGCGLGRRVQGSEVNWAEARVGFSLVREAGAVSKFSLPLSGFREQGVAFRGWGLAFEVWGVGCRVWGVGCGA